MSLGISAEQRFDVIDVKDDEPILLACIAPRVEVATGYLLFSRIVVDSDVYDVLAIAPNSGYFRSMIAKG